MTTRSRTMRRLHGPMPRRSGAHALATLALSMALAFSLAACRKPQPPDPEVPPEPQAGIAATPAPSTATAARHAPATADARAIVSRDVGRDAGEDEQTPLERVRDVETKLGDAAERTRATIDPP